MQIRNWRPGLVACLAAAGTAVAACGSHASPGQPAVRQLTAAAASAHPCLLISASEAQAILGGHVAKPSVGLGGGSCAYQSSAGPQVLVSAEKGAVSISLVAGIEISSPAPARGVGHDAECGTSKQNPASQTLLGSIGQDGSLQIIGPSCAVDARFARLAYQGLKT